MKKSRQAIFSFWMVFLLSSFTLAFAQKSLLDKKINLTVKDQTIGNVLDEIGKLGGFHFSYGNKYIPTEKKVTMEVKNETIDEILKQLFNDLNIQFLEVEGEIILKPLAVEELKKKEPVEYTVSGYLYDMGSGESLIGATVLVIDSGIGTVSNSFGFYSLTLPEGDYILQFSYIGFKSFRASIKLREDVVYNIELQEDASSIQEVTITRGEEESFGLGLVQTSRINLKPQTVKKIPALFGEVDVIKSLEAVPGISFFGDGSTLFYVRGGNKDQNLILVDDAPIFNPAHLFGFFSNIIPDAVKDINVYKGDMPAQMGGRLSSIVDVRTKDGNLKKFGITGSTGFVASHLSLETPIVKDKASLFFSGRRSHFKWLVHNFNSAVETMYFADVNAKLNYVVNDKNHLYLSFYYGKDNFLNESGRGDASGINWGNTSGSLRWNHLVNDKLFLNTTFYTAKYDYYLVTSQNNDDKWNSRIRNTGLKTDFTYFHNPNATFDFGFMIGTHEINPGNFKFGDDSRNSGVPKVPVRNSLEWVGYINYEQQLGEKWSLRAGLRAVLWQNIGKATEYVFDESNRPVDTLHYASGKIYNSYFTPQPRLAISYKFPSYSSVRAAYSRNVQNIHQITNSVSPFTSLDVWLPSGPNIKPQVSDQISLGYYKLFSSSGMKLTVEAYHKVMRNQIDYEYHAKMLLNPVIEGELRFGNAWSYGVEFLLQKEIGRFNGWIGYSLSRTTKKIDGIYQDKAYPAFYDRPHDFSAFLSYSLGRRWTISGLWIYTSGAAFTTPTSFYYYQGYSIPIYAEKNNDRLPAYHRLDLTINVKLNTPESRFKHDLTLSMFNVYGRKNPISVNFNKTVNQSDNMVIPVNYIPLPELFPSQIWLYQMVPSLNYNFRF